MQMQQRSFASQRAVPQQQGGAATERCLLVHHRSQPASLLHEGVPWETATANGALLR
jgi:hypothetical protein